MSGDHPPILLVEDEVALARGLRDNLEAEGFRVHHVARGDEVLAAVRRHSPRLVVLDLMLPGRPGLDVLRELRRRDAALPVLVLTARGDVVDRVVGLELGADDYLAKPFDVREFVARLRALLRRAAASPARPTLRVGPVTFDFEGLHASGTPAAERLTVHDLLVLKTLWERVGEAVPRADVVEEVCGLDADATDRTVDNHVVALRRALGDDPRRPRWLQTVRSVGYRLVVDDAGPPRGGRRDDAPDTPDMR